MCKKHSFHSVNYFLSLGFQVHLEVILVKVWKYLSQPEVPGDFHSNLCSRSILEEKRGVRIR